MTAATNPRIAQESGSVMFSDPVKAGEAIERGWLVMLDSTGRAVEAVTGANLTPRGVCLEQADNTDGQDGDIRVNCKAGTWPFFNSDSGDEITAGDAGNVCYVVDNQTVAKTSNSSARSPAGVIKRVRDDGQVEVYIGDIAAADGDLLAANNLSEVTPATARANIGANVVDFNVYIDDLVAADAKRYGFCAPHGFVISKIKSVLLGHALVAGDATLTAKIAGTAVTTGVITITQSGSAIGDVDTCTPSALKTATEDQFVEILVGGGNTDTAARAMVTFTCTR